MKILNGKQCPDLWSQWICPSRFGMVILALLCLIFLLPAFSMAHTYSLESSGCSGGPYADNALFTIDGDQLSTATSFNYETKTSCTICIRTTDNGGNTFDKEFTISINNVDEIPVVDTNAATSITMTTATGNGDVTDLGGPNPTQHGICWSTSANPTTSDAKTEQGGTSTTGTFTGSMTGLTPGTRYHYRAYATNTVGTAYGEDQTFTTLNPPLVTTQAATSITATTATGNGNITNLGIPNPTQHGVCWSTSANPTTADSKTEEGPASATGAFTSSITGLSAGTEYHYRAYATNSVTTVYGADQTFSTLKQATVTTQAASDITPTTATGNGSITDLGDPDPTQHGVCWSTSANPTTADSKTEEGPASATGAFTSSITGLSAGTEYHYRAYATNSVGTSYGADQTFTTFKQPAVTTQAASNITDTAASGNGNITDLGVPNPTQHGVCWSTSANPTISDLKTEEGAASATGAFASSMTGLTPATEYHYRAYATNSVTTVYGADLTFTTFKQPTVTTQAASEIAATTATGNGNITDLGDPNPTQYGVCWSTSANPTTLDSKTEEGAASATGAFTGNMTGLTPGTEYHYRAYATNSVTTVYGADQTFSTLKQATVTTQAASDITSTTATGNGSITDLGDPNPTQHGVCWSTTANPTTADSKTEEGAASETGAFTSSITGLTAGTEYHYRAYATNSVGTTYGADQTFTTFKQPAVTTQAASNIMDTTAAGNGNITDLGVPNPTQHGVCWSTSANPTISDPKTEEGPASVTGAFTSDITGLAPGTLYHYRAYATNSVDTVYGEDQTFTTLIPDLTVSKSNNQGGAITLGGNWTWTLTLSNTGSAGATFTSGQVILTDNLPNTNISYGTASVSNTVNITNPGNIDASISSNTLTVSATGGAVTMGALTGSFDITFTATPSSGGSFVNPRSAGICTIDPANVIAEDNEGNNSASDTLSVSAAEINIKHWSTNIPDGGTFDFGSHLITTNTITIFTIENTGGADLTLTTPLTITGTDADQFSVISQPSSPVLAASTTSFSVRFSPTTQGVKTAAISIINNDGDETPYDLNLNGTGTVAPEIEVSGKGSVIVNGDGSPSTSDGTYFGKVEIFGRTVERAYTIKNTGTGELTITLPISISGANAREFSVIQAPSATVAAGADTIFKIRFDPRHLGARYADITIVSNDSDESSYAFKVQGKGIDPALLPIGTKGNKIIWNYYE